MLSSVASFFVKSSVFLLISLVSHVIAVDENLCEEDVLLALSRLKNYPNIADWNVETTNNEIRLTSKFEVSSTTAQTVLVDDFNLEKWKKDSAEKFWIQIRFEPLMPYSEYKKQRDQRLRLADVINEDYQNFEGDPLPNEIFDETWEKLLKKKIPTHIAAYSNVYIESSMDDPNISFDPNENLQKCVWMLYRLGFLFSEVLK